MRNLGCANSWTLPQLVTPARKACEPGSRTSLTHPSPGKHGMSTLLKLPKAMGKTRTLPTFLKPPTIAPTFRLETAWTAELEWMEVVAAAPTNHTFVITCFTNQNNQTRLWRGKKANNQEMISTYSFLWPVVGLVKEASRPFPSLDLYLVILGFTST